MRLHHAQHRRADDPAWTLELARRVVAAKIGNQRRLLVRAQRRRPDPEVAKAAVALRHAVEATAGAADLDTLRGVEGAAAARYFRAFGRLLHVEWTRFEVRRRRPPPARPVPARGGPSPPGRSAPPHAGQSMSS